jgi:hypothetical protein
MADARGRAAGAAVEPRRFTIVEPKSPLDPTSPVRRAYPGETLMGSVRITLRPGNSTLARVARTMCHAEPGCYGGLILHLDPFESCYDRNMAYGLAFLSTLVERGHRHVQLGVSGG